MTPERARGPLAVACTLLGLIAVLAAGSPLTSVRAAGRYGHSLRPAKTAPTRTVAFEDSRVVPTVRELIKQAPYLRYLVCPTTKPPAGMVTFAKAIAHARAVEHKAGAAAVHRVETGRDANPRLAEIDAANAMAGGNPVGALAALLSAYDHDRKNPTHLRNLGAVLAQISMPREALAVLNQADKLKAKPQAPMGISEADSELTNKGYALVQLGQYARARKLLTKAVADAPMLSEAKTDLGAAYLCDNKPAKAAPLFFAGARRQRFDTVDESGSPPVQETQVPAASLWDLSAGKAGTLPTLNYPKTVADVIRDGTTFTVGQNAWGSLVQYYASLSNQESNQIPLFPLLQPLPRVSSMRVQEIQQAAFDPAMGGYQSLVDAVGQAELPESQLWSNTFTGQCGDACMEWEKIENSDPNGDTCGTDWPEMEAWLNGKSKTFSADMERLDRAERADWSAQSKWATGLIANISNRKIVKSLSLSLDSDKQDTMYFLASQVGFWESGVNRYAGYCSNGNGAAEKPPADSKDIPPACPQSLKDHGFSFEVGVFSISANCESISVTAEEEILGPFVRVSVTRSGGVTITAGAHAGVSMGPMSADVEAGVYVTVDSTGLTGGGVTANAGATAKAGSISMDVNSAGYTGSFTDVASGITQAFR